MRPAIMSSQKRTVGGLLRLSDCTLSGQISGWLCGHGTIIRVSPCAWRVLPRSTRMYRLRTMWAPLPPKALLPPPVSWAKRAAIAESALANLGCSSPSRLSALKSRLTYTLWFRNASHIYARRAP